MNPRAASSCRRTITPAVLCGAWGRPFRHGPDPEDMSFVHSSWEEGIEAWRFKLPGEAGAAPLWPTAFLTAACCAR